MRLWNKPLIGGEQTAGTSHNLIVAIAPKTAAELSEQLGPVKADYEQVAVTGQFVFWSAPVKTHGRTRLGDNC
ncbi:hypothetical protein QY882_01750 [Latilactobacillus sakei]